LLNKPGTMANSGTKKQAKLQPACTCRMGVAIGHKSHAWKYGNKPDGPWGLNCT